MDPGRLTRRALGVELNMDNYPFGSGGSSEPQATDDNKIGSSHSVSTQAAGNLGASFVLDLDCV